MIRLNTPLVQQLLGDQLILQHRKSMTLRQWVGVYGTMRNFQHEISKMTDNKFKIISLKAW